MARTTHIIARRHRRKKILKAAKGFVGGRRRYRQAVETVHKGWTYSFRDRRARKGDFRRLWIQRINAAVRPHGFTYGRFMDALKKIQVNMNRKVLAELAARDPGAFDTLINWVKGASKA
ncbi:MAG: 50S ribosomal protein L20 [Candidatus Omnitrophica bacterium]|nr:50S ribosomal protein L20 [Candidatus Omnitrophota bacterium]